MLWIPFAVVALCVVIGVLVEASRQTPSPRAVPGRDATTPVDDDAVIFRPGKGIGHFGMLLAARIEANIRKLAAREGTVSSVLLIFCVVGLVSAGGTLALINAPQFFKDTAAVVCMMCVLVCVVLITRLYTRMHELESSVMHLRNVFPPGEVSRGGGTFSVGGGGFMRSMSHDESTSRAAAPPPSTVQENKFALGPWVISVSPSHSLTFSYFGRETLSVSNNGTVTLLRCWNIEPSTERLNINYSPIPTTQLSGAAAVALRAPNAHNNVSFSLTNDGGVVFGDCSLPSASGTILDQGWTVKPVGDVLQISANYKETPATVKLFRRGGNIVEASRGHLFHLALTAKGTAVVTNANATSSDEQYDYRDRQKLQSLQQLGYVKSLTAAAAVAAAPQFAASAEYYSALNVTPIEKATAQARDDEATAIVYPTSSSHYPYNNSTNSSRADVQNVSSSGNEESYTPDLMASAAAAHAYLSRTTPQSASTPRKSNINYNNVNNQRSVKWVEEKGTGTPPRFVAGRQQHQQQRSSSSRSQSPTSQRR